MFDRQSVENLLQQQRSAMHITDALFGNPEPKRRNPESRIDEAIGLAHKLETLCRELSFEFTDKRGNLEEATEFAHDALMNLAGHKLDVNEGRE